MRGPERTDITVASMMLLCNLQSQQIDSSH